MKINCNSVFGHSVAAEHNTSDFLGVPQQDIRQDVGGT